ncbi:MAG: hypothetical protein JW915_01295 [Chitinispirillaceae bacterium]|nr:hypothetical protein [Chitinispirillaceae bacterium]
MLEYHYTVDFNSLQIAFAIKINDTLVVTNDSYNLPSGSLPINQWLYNGNNKYHITLFVNPKWDEELIENNFRFKIFENTGAEREFTQREVVSEHWEYHQGTQFPVTFEGNFSLQIPYGKWEWLSADQLSVETLDMHSLKDYISTLHLHLRNRDFESLEPFLKTKALELGKSFYIDEHERLLDQETFFTKELFHNPDWGMQSLDFNGMLFRFHAENRLVEVLAKNGKSLLRSNSMDGCTFSLQLFLCHKNNQWILCR